MKDSKHLFDFILAIIAVLATILAYSIYLKAIS